MNRTAKWVNSEEHDAIPEDKYREKMIEIINESGEINLGLGHSLEQEKRCEWRIDCQNPDFDPEILIEAIYGSESYEECVRKLIKAFGIPKKCSLKFISEIFVHP